MKIFRNKAFRYLVGATTISSLGDSLYSLAITLSVYKITGSIIGVALMWLIRALIRIPCQFMAGIVIDYFDKKKVSIMVYFISAVLMILFSLFGSRYVVFAYIIIFILQGVSDVDNMAQMGIISEIVAKEELIDAENIFSAIGTIIMLLGPGIGGVLYKFYGEQILYVIDAITFFIAIFCLWSLPYKENTNSKKEIKFMLFKHAQNGVMEVKKIPVIQYMIVMSIIFGIFGRLYEIDKVLVADKILGIGAEGIVYFSYAMSIGSLIATLYTKILSKYNTSDLKKYMCTSILCIVSFVLWGSTDNMLLSLTTNVLIGIFSTSQEILMNVIFMSKVKKEVMGMVMSFRKIVVVISAVAGAVFAPVLVKYIGVSYSFIGWGVIGLLLGMTIYFIVKRK